MANSNMINPPVFKDGDMEYKEWRKDIKLWTLLTDLPKSKMAIAVHLSLSGRARKASSELTEDELKADNGITTLLARLDKLYLQDANWNLFNNYLSFEKFCRSSETSIEDLFYEFDQQRWKLKKCGVDLPEAVLACRLLRSFNLSDVHFQLVLTTISYMTLDDMYKTLKRLFTEDGIINIPKDDEVSLELTQNMKVEPVRFTEGYQEHYTNNIEQLEESSSYYEGMMQKEQDNSLPGETQSITGEIEHIVVNQSIDEDVEHEQNQFNSNRTNVKEELPDYIEGIENRDVFFDRLDYSNQDHNLSKQNDQQKSINCSEGNGNLMQTLFHNNESIECWLRRNLCSVKLQNLNQTKQQNKGNYLQSEIEENKMDRNNSQVFQSVLSSQARKSGRRAKLPEKFKEYEYVLPNKKSQPSKVGHTHSSKKSLESNTNIISTSKNQKDVNKKNDILPEGSRKQKILRSEVSDKSFDVYYSRGHPKEIINAKNRKEMDDNSTVQEGKTPGKQHQVSGSTKDEKSCSSSLDRNKKRFSNKCKESFGCPHCPKTFRCQRKYLRHLKGHSNPKNNGCTECYRSFESEQSLAIHLLHHRNPATIGPFVCSYCSREFDYKFAWQRHVYIFHEKEDNKAVQVCHACKMSFRSKMTFRRHRLKYHREEVNKETIEKKMKNKFKVCPYCNKEITRNNFNNHLAIHKEGRERDNICSHCGKGFSNNGNLQRHKVRCVESKQNIPVKRFAQFSSTDPDPNFINAVTSLSVKKEENG